MLLRDHVDDYRRFTLVVKFRSVSLLKRHHAPLPRFEVVGELLDVRTARRG